MMKCELCGAMCWPHVRLDERGKVFLTCNWCYPTPCTVGRTRPATGDDALALVSMYTPVRLHR